MDSKGKRIGGGLLAVLAAAILACGTIQGGAGKSEPGLGGGGDTLITSDDSSGVGQQQATGSGGPMAAPDEGSGPSLQP